MSVALEHLAIQGPVPPEELNRLHQLAPELRVSLFTADQLDRVATADAIWSGPLDLNGDQLLDLAPRLRWLHSFGAGVDVWLAPGFIESPVLLTNSRGIHGIQMAEQILAVFLAHSRQLPALIRGQQQALHHPALGQFELHGQRLLILGLGHIGHQVAQRAQAFGLRVTGIKRHPVRAEPPAYLEQVLDFSQLDNALAHADLVLSLLPLTAETRQLFNAERFRQFKTGAYFYNFGRGASVDTDALLTALQQGKLAGAGLDVTDPEPLPAGHPLRQLPQVILTAHTGGATPVYRQRALNLARSNLQQWLVRQPLQNLVDKRLGY